MSAVEERQSIWSIGVRHIKLRFILYIVEDFFAGGFYNMTAVNPLFFGPGQSILLRRGSVFQTILGVIPIPFIVSPPVVQTETYLQSSFFESSYYQSEYNENIYNEQAYGQSPFSSLEPIVS